MRIYAVKKCSQWLEAGERELFNTNCENWHHANCEIAYPVDERRMDFNISHDYLIIFFSFIYFMCSKQDVQSSQIESVVSSVAGLPNHAYK